MRLFLAVAVLMLALVAYTEAQGESSEEAPDFREKMVAVVEKVQTTYDNAREWVRDRVEHVKDTFQKAG